MNELKLPGLEIKKLSELSPSPRNARTHSKKQVRQIADSMERFGFTSPILIDDEGMILAGHGRAAAASLGSSGLRGAYESRAGKRGIVGGAEYERIASKLVEGFNELPLEERQRVKADIPGFSINIVAEGAS